MREKSRKIRLDVKNMIEDFLLRKARHRQVAGATFHYHEDTNLLTDDLLARSVHLQIQVLFCCYPLLRVIVDCDIENRFQQSRRLLYR